jgi:hypothetical protein
MIVDKRDHDFSSRRSNGSIGLITADCWSRSAISRRPKPSNAITPSWKCLTWRHNLTETASGKPGAVHNPDLGRIQNTLRAGGDVTAALAEIAGRIQKAAAKFDAADEKVAGALPMLSGSPRQIAWATEIRAKAAEKNSKLSALKTATSAKYWIENRAKFAA